MLNSILLSLQVATVATIMVAIVGLFVAYFLATRNFAGKEIIEIIFTLPLVLPPTVIGYYLIIILGRNGFLGSLIYQYTGWSIMFTWYAAVLASFIVSLPLMIKSSQAAIESVDKTMINSSYMLGYSQFETYLKVVFPLARKGIMAGIVLSFARAIGEFGATLMIAGNIPGRTDTMPLAIYGFTTTGEWDKAHVMVIALTLFSGLFLYMANKFSKRNF